MCHRSRHLPALCVLGTLLLTAPVLCSQPAAHASWQRYQITVDDGSGNVQQYDETTARAKIQEQFNDLGRRPPEANRPADVSKKAPPITRAQETAEPPVLDLGITLPDGRRLPFAIGPKIKEGLGATLRDTTDAPKKTVDESVDPYSALRNYNRLDDELASRRYDPRQWDGSSRAEFGTDDLRTATAMNEWHSRFNAWPNFQNLPIAPNNAFDAPPRNKPLLDHDRSNTHSAAPQANERAQHRNLDQRLPGERNNSYATTQPTDLETYLQERYRRFENLSMQDINRYQFRRAHSTQPGFPVTTPGSPTLKHKTH